MKNTQDVIRQGIQLQASGRITSPGHGNSMLCLASGGYPPGRKQVYAVAVLSVFLSFFMFSGMAGALVCQGSCYNETHLSISCQFSMENESFTIDQSPIPCPFNCMEGLRKYGADCNPSPQEASPEGSIPIVVVFSLAAIIFMYVSLHLAKEHSFMGWMLLVMSILMIVVALFLTISFQPDEGVKNIISTSGFGVIIVLITIIAYVCIFFLTAGFKKLAKPKDPYGDIFGPGRR